MNRGLLDLCMLLWDRRKDTKDMAAETGHPEWVCALALRIGREERMIERGHASEACAT